MRVYIVIILALIAVACDPCASVEPRVYLLFVSDTSGAKLDLEFDRVYEQGQKSNLSFNNLGYIPLNLSDTAVTYVFERKARADTLHVSYNTMFNRSTNRYCMSISNVQVRQHSFIDVGSVNRKPLEDNPDNLVLYELEIRY